MDDKTKERFINEICGHSGLQEFRDLLCETVDVITSKGFVVYCRNDLDQSVIDWSNRIIRIYVPLTPAKYLNSLWSLLHETGHLVNGNSGPSLQSELEAWKYAQNIAENRLPDMVELFNIYKSHCLRSYGYL